MIGLSKPSFDDNEINAVNEVLKSGWVAGQGPKNKELASAICKYTGSKNAVPVNNCTAGLHLALLAIGVKSGDEVIVSDFTYPATGHSVLYCGAIPRFVDVELDTYNINPELIQEKINKNTKAIIVVHALGQTAKMDRIMEIAKSNNIPVIEDAACSLGATYKGIHAGKFGDITAYSFHARKNVTSGEGGIVVTDNSVYAAKMSSLSCFGMESAFARQDEFNVPVFNSLGYNYKLSDINAAIAVEQLKKYEDYLKKRFQLVKHYNDLLKDSKYLKIPAQMDNARHVYQTYAVLLNDNIDRNKLILKLRDKEIQSQIATYSSFVQPIYKSEDKCPNSLKLFNSALALPLHNELTNNDIEFIVTTLNNEIEKLINL